VIVVVVRGGEDVLVDRKTAVFVIVGRRKGVFVVMIEKTTVIVPPGGTCTF